MTMYNVYVGYYEVFITRHNFPQYALSSRHRSAAAATMRVEKDYPSASVFYDEDAYADCFGDYFFYDDSQRPLFTMEDDKGKKINFYD